MKRKFLVFFTLAIVCSLIVSSFLSNIVRAATTGTVAATVTAVIYSVTLDNASGVAFGSVAQSSTKDTTTAGVNDSTNAVNNGSVAEKLNIQAGDSTGGTGWVLNNAAGSEKYTMKSCTTNCDASPTWTSVGIGSSSVYAQLMASVGVGSSTPFDLQVGTPTSTTVTTEQAINITIQAAAP